MERVISFETARLIPSDYDGESVAAYTKEGYIYPKSYLYSTQPGESFPCVRCDDLQAWLREKHHIHVMIGVDDLDWWWQLYDSSANGRLKEYNQITESYAGKKTYEEAMEEGLFKALEILKTIQEK